MSLVSLIGPRPNLLDLPKVRQAEAARVNQPILTNGDLERIRSIGQHRGPLRTKTLDITYSSRRGCRRHEGGARGLCDRGRRSGRGGYNIIILSDRRRSSGPDCDPGVAGNRSRAPPPDPRGPAHSVGLVVETGEPREVHHFATASRAMAPRRSTPTSPSTPARLLRSAANFRSEVSQYEVVSTRYIKAVGKGLLKVMSKMGISTYQSYCGAQIFDASGCRPRFRRTPTSPAPRADRRRRADPRSPPRPPTRHRLAFGDDPVLATSLDVGGDYAFRMRGEDHIWTPDDGRHAAARSARQRMETLSGILPRWSTSSTRMNAIARPVRFKAEAAGRKPVPLDEVEPAAEIVKRFATGAMSFGSSATRRIRRWPRR
jgi:glutamate synthase (NADPH/NADH) large chain